MDIFPHPSSELSDTRKRLAPATEAAFRAFSKQVFSDGALPAKVKQLIAVAVAHVTQCPYCIRGHTKSALRHGASPQKSMEAICVAAEMRAGGGALIHDVAVRELLRVLALCDHRDDDIAIGHRAYRAPLGCCRLLRDDEEADVLLAQELGRRDEIGARRCGDDLRLQTLPTFMIEPCGFGADSERSAAIASYVFPAMPAAGDSPFRFHARQCASRRAAKVRGVSR